MRLLVDSHTHTIVSGHAYSTLHENLEFAANKGLQGIVVSDHSESIPGAQPNFTMNIHNTFPAEWRGVRIIRGAEVNIIDFNGGIDMKEKYLSIADFVIASLHDVVIDPGSKLDNTTAMLGALANPHVDIIGHPGNPYYEVDLEAVVKEAARLNKLLEVNSHSFSFRTGSPSVCRSMMRLCMKYGVRISVGSDAHCCYQVGGFDDALIALMDEGFPEELIVSRNMETFHAYLAERNRRIGEYNPKAV